MHQSDTNRWKPLRSNFVRRGFGALISLAAASAIAFAPFAVGADKTKAAAASLAALEQQKLALAEFNSFIGGWRGIGMPRRGSRAGAWSETADWVWQFEKNSVAIDYKIAKGKLLQSGRVTYNPDRKVFLLSGTFADKVRRNYEGQVKNKKLVFESKAADGYVHLLTFSRVNSKRSLVLYQKRRANSRFLSRVAEVGYTRAGTSLAVEGAGEIECVVTGGKGTMPVKYKGQTYYVCCSGCRDAFNDDPAGVIAAYKLKLAERKKKRAKTK
ncbi:MAG: hypothetical protein HOL01_23250 [Planctomycetaceae bacterium]|jgi:hypothetical protein|nr:hypothetical protein [Planctomycetaceae bacterium]MBT6485659.1 hypothetical protein [Planctomycetaceae bacterium]MBT6497439.1 hypothetical protein [Planctomycetaceae bacterium]